MHTPNIVLIDFNDSFSLNIVSEFYRLGISIELISVDEFFIAYDTQNIHFEPDQYFIFGPGPGHPEEYFNKYPLNCFLQEYFRSAQNRLLGICLGHQIIGSYFGYGITESRQKKHGEAVKYLVQNGDPCFPNSLENQVLELQRYNSLCLQKENRITQANIFEGLDENGEILCLSGSKFLTYQFHPESIGTIYRKKIFYYLAQSLYNWSNE